MELQISVACPLVFNVTFKTETSFVLLRTLDPLTVIAHALEGSSNVGLVAKEDKDFHVTRELASTTLGGYKVMVGPPMRESSLAATI